jgi:hypothetical protein
MTEIPDELSLPEEAFEQQRALLSARAAHESRRTRFGRRRPLAVGIALTVLLGVLLVTPAFGVGGKLLDSIRGNPAPPEVRATFASSDQARKDLLALAHEAGERLQDRYSPVRADQTRGVYAIETTDGPIYLWAAPTQDGRECWMIQTSARPGGFGSCDRGNDENPLSAGIAGAPLDQPSVQILHARVIDESITRVVFELEESPAVSLRVIDGYVLGTVSKDARIVAIVGRDAGDREVVRRTIP